MQSIDFSNPIILLPLVFVVVIILFFIIYSSRYRKFRPNEYVIWLRNGEVRKAEKGGSGWLMPLIDEVIIIPVTVQQTLLEAKERVVSHEYQDLSVTAFIYWRVVNPEIAFSKVSWDASQQDYVEKVIKNAAESIIRTTCANMPIEQIIRERQEIIKVITSELHSLMADWGITTESVEIRDVEVLDHQLKENLEAVKKIAEEQKAKLRSAEMIELTKLRDLEGLNQGHVPVRPYTRTAGGIHQPHQTESTAGDLRPCSGRSSQTHRVLPLRSAIFLRSGTGGQT